jgi:GAF domain-containing protein
MHIDDEQLQRALGRLAQQDLRRLGLADALADITGAMPDLFAVDGAGVLLVDESQVLRYVASTDQAADLLEAAQESSGHGPCVEAFVDNVIVRVDDFVTDDRWPDLAAILVPNGVRAVLGAPVRVGGLPVGSLNVYKQAAHIWDDSDVTALTAFDRLAEDILAAALINEHHDALVGQLQHALETRAVIERAIGFLMATDDLSASDAFERVRRAARSSRRPVRDIASDIIRYRGMNH